MRRRALSFWAEPFFCFWGYGYVLGLSPLRAYAYGGAPISAKYGALSVLCARAIALARIRTVFYGLSRHPIRVGGALNTKCRFLGYLRRCEKRSFGTVRVRFRSSFGR